MLTKIVLVKEKEVLHLLNLKIRSISIYNQLLEKQKMKEALLTLIGAKKMTL